MYIKIVNFNLYNFLENASSSKHYEYTDHAKQKSGKKIAR